MLLPWAGLIFTRASCFAPPLGLIQTVIGSPVVRGKT